MLLGDIVVLTFCSMPILVTHCQVIAISTCKAHIFHTLHILLTYFCSIASLYLPSLSIYLLPCTCTLNTLHLTLFDAKALCITISACQGTQCPYRPLTLGLLIVPILLPLSTPQAKTVLSLRVVVLLDKFLDHALSTFHTAFSVHRVWFS